MTRKLKFIAHDLIAASCYDTETVVRTFSDFDVAEQLAAREWLRRYGAHTWQSAALERI